MSNVNELLVFVASPGDLAEERAELRDIERRVNSLFGTAGQRVRVTGWEETPPGYGRPQGQINPMVDDCDVFVGLLRRRWGSPTGVSDSGFAEEFERALERRKQSDVVPEIAMYFADISQDELDDAGPELNRVLEFRRRLETERIALYSTFATPRDLATQVTELLYGYLVKRVLDKHALTGPTGVVVPNASNATDTPSKEVAEVGGSRSGPDSAQQQIVDALDVLRKKLTGGDIDIALDVDRLELVGVAFGQDKSTLGTHLVNRLYRRLDDLELVGAEYTAWVRTLLADVSNHTSMVDRVIPGWSILSRDARQREDQLLQFAIEEGAVGRGAVKALHRLGARPDSLWANSNEAVDEAGHGQARSTEMASLWVDLLNANPGQNEITNYLLQDAAAEEPDTVELLLQLITRILEVPDLNEDSKSFLGSFIQALSDSPDELAEKLGYSAGTSGPWALVLGQISKLDLKLLNRLANQNFNKTAKLAAASWGLAAGVLTDATLTTLLLENDDEIQRLLVGATTADTEAATRFLTLIRDRPAGKPKPTGLEGRLIAQSASLDVVVQLDSKSDYNNAAWEALTYLTPAKFMPEARQVLESDASALRASLRDSLRDEDTVIDYLAEDRKRISASLIARSDSRTSADVQLVLTWFKQEADTGYIPKHALRIVEKIAVDSFDEIPSDYFDAYGETLGFSSSGELLDGPLGPFVTPVLRKSSATWVREPAEIWHISRDERSTDELEEALYHDLPAVRIAAAQSLVRRLDQEALRSVLVKYPSRKGQHWYNVIATLDEHLNAPPRSDDC